MIHFENVSFKNFLSVGNVPMKYALNTHNITLITGTNGSAKSAMADAIHYALFGKPFRKIKLGQLPNSINQKNMFVSLDFKDAKHSYRIERGIKPQVFKIYCDGKIVEPPASLSDYQTYLENNVLKFNSKTFSQCVLLGSTSYTPFMKLNGTDRRQIIEYLLDLHIFSDMNIITKERYSAGKTSLIKFDSAISLVESELDIKQAHNDRIKSDVADKIKSLNDSNVLINSSVKDKNKQRFRLEESQARLLASVADHDSHKQKQIKMNGYYSQFDRKISALETQHNFYHDNDVCPKCSQDISEETKQRHKQECQEKQEKVNLARAKLDIDIVEITNIIAVQSRILEEVTAISTDIISIQTDLDILDDNLTRNTNEIKDLESTDASTVEDLNPIRSKLKVLKRERSSVFSQQTVLSNIQTLLKDDGIKARIIEKYLPTLNTMITKYLEILDFNCQFSFDENFDEIIKSRGRDKFSYYNFSEGERLRIDLSILFAFREFASRKNTLKTNLLLLDEIGGGTMDAAGIDAIKRIVQSQEDNNIFFISHHDEFKTFADLHVTVRKKGNFSIKDDG